MRLPAIHISHFVFARPAIGPLPILPLQLNYSNSKQSTGSMAEAECGALRSRGLAVHRAKSMAWGVGRAAASDVARARQGDAGCVCRLAPASAGAPSARDGPGTNGRNRRAIVGMT